MHPHQYALAAGILWLATLIVLPYLFAKARSRAYELGFTDGKLAHQQALKLRLQEANRVQEVLRATIAELEARIMSYTAMPVTRADYDLMISAAETLALAEKTWKAAPGTEPWWNRAKKQRQGMQALALRVHSQLRTTPATAADAEKAA